MLLPFPDFLLEPVRLLEVSFFFLSADDGLVVARAVEALVLSLVVGVAATAAGLEEGGCAERTKDEEAALVGISMALLGERGE